MRDGMPYDPIQGQGQGHGASEVPKMHFSKSVSSAIYNGSWQMTTDQGWQLLPTCSFNHG